MLKELEAELTARGGESTVMENLLEHIVTRITDEGLVIELFASDERPLFEGETDAPTDLMIALVDVVASVAITATNSIAIGGHVRAKPVVIADNPVWDISAQRASRTRQMLQSSGIEPERMHRMTGHADREPAHTNPLATRNDRVEIVLLRN